MKIATCSPVVRPKTAAKIAAGAAAASMCHGAAAKQIPKESCRGHPAHKNVVQNFLKTAMCLAASVGNTVSQPTPALPAATMESCMGMAGPVHKRPKNPVCGPDECWFEHIGDSGAGRMIWSEAAMKEQGIPKAFWETFTGQASQSLQFDTGNGPVAAD